MAKQTQPVESKRSECGNWIHNTSIFWQQCCVLVDRSRPLEKGEARLRLARSIFVEARKQVTSIKEWLLSNWSFDPYYEPEASLIQIDSERRLS